MALRLATTTSVYDSGLLDRLLEAFLRETGIRVQVLAVGTGQALRLAERKDVDAVLVHAPSLEREALARGITAEPYCLAQNAFLLAGPEADPAQVREAENVLEALRRIAAQKAPFVSRGDRSGTHLKELELWEKAGLKPMAPVIEQALRDKTQKPSPRQTAFETWFKAVIDETKQWMQAHAEENGRAQARAATDKEYGKYGRDISWFISETLEQMQAIKDADSKLPDGDYVNDLKYKALVTRMLSSQEWAKQKLRLWLENEETNIGDIATSELKSAHRQWLSFLKQRQHAVAAAGSVQRKAAAVKILQCKGLMVTEDASAEEADGEPLIYAAAADGWALEDVKVWRARAGKLKRGCL